MGKTSMNALSENLQYCTIEYMESTDLVYKFSIIELNFVITGEIMIFFWLQV